MPWARPARRINAQPRRTNSAPAGPQQLRADIEGPMGPEGGFSKRWDLMVVEEPQLPQHQALKGKSIAEIAAAQGKDVLDAFLDLAVAEHLDMVFVLGEINVDPEAVATL